MARAKLSPLLLVCIIRSFSASRRFLFLTKTDIPRGLTGLRGNCAASAKEPSTNRRRKPTWLGAQVRSQHMAKCNICKWNPDAKTYWSGCPHAQGELWEGVACSQCPESCGEPAIFIAGRLICSKHAHLIPKMIGIKKEDEV